MLNYETAVPFCIITEVSSAALYLKESVGIRVICLLLLNSSILPLRGSQLRSFSTLEKFTL
jgi:hypothetical protein